MNTNRKPLFLFTFFLLAALVASILTGCGGAKPKVALMLARGGLGDKAFNDSANEGLQKADRKSVV